MAQGALSAADRQAMVAHAERARLLGELDSMDHESESGHRFLRTREVAMLFQVSERAVTDWAARGRLPSVRTPGGHRRYPAGAVRELLDQVGLR
jgi:excisionase family DNA binding protein